MAAPVFFYGVDLAYRVYIVFIRHWAFVDIVKIEAVQHDVVKYMPSCDILSRSSLSLSFSLFLTHNKHNSFLIKTHSCSNIILTESQ